MLRAHLLRTAIAASGIVLLLGACQARVDGVPRVTAETDDVTLTIGEDNHGGRNGHCPPGHHMKGWC